MKEKLPATARAKQRRPSLGKPNNEKKGTASGTAVTIPYAGSSAQADVRVTKSNALIEANYRLTLNETRLVTLCIGYIDSRVPLDEQRIFRIQAAEFQARYKMGREKAYEALKEIADRLFERKIVLRDPSTGRAIKLRWVSACTYLEGQGAVQLHFAPEILPYLSGIRERFTSYWLSAVSNFTSTFAIRLYEILDQYLTLGKRTASVDDLRLWLDCADKFERYTDFERWVIKVAVDQINEHSDLRVSYKKIKQGRTVSHLEFSFARLKQAVVPKAEKAAVPGVRVVSEAESREQNERAWRFQMLRYGVDPNTGRRLADQAVNNPDAVEHSDTKAD